MSNGHRIQWIQGKTALLVVQPGICGMDYRQGI